MQDVIIGVYGTLNNGAQDVDLLVHSHNVGNPSPCHIYKDGAYGGMIGGSISSLDEIFELEAARHRGFTVRRRDYYVARISSESEEKSEPNANPNSRS